MPSPALVLVDPVTGSFEAADPGAPHLRVDDLAAVRGDGIFETLLHRNGVSRALEAHLSRFANSARMLDLPAPDPQLWRSAIGAVIDNHGDADEIAVRFTLSRGPDGANSPTGWALASTPSAAVLAERSNGIDVLALDRGFASGTAERAPWLLLGAKTLSYAVNMAALRYARQHDKHDVVFTTSDGVVLEGPTSTVVIARGRELLTPEPSSGILFGTMQRELFRAASDAGWTCGYKDLSVQDIVTADGAWLCSSVRLLAAINSLDGRALPADPKLQAEIKALLLQ
ncbi:aminodeoxychorismate lyase [Saxibacter everestensis]|uniref:Aminodeoxychorismate lyase n=1 Tax=Saxibacter everestensis TaxID=2909229 RepID=A0ABY8QST0_9MICO|nr:aminodeoxychorismate lyase [Brevibacteriaceae bacterium ZFBP1038]